MDTDFSKLFFRSFDPMWVFDQETLGFLAVNEAAIWEYGYKREDFQAMSILDIRPKDDIDILQRTLKETLGDHYFKDTYRHLKRDRSIREVQIARYEIEFDSRKAFLINPLPIAKDPSARSFEKLFDKINYALLQNMDSQRKRMAELIKLTKTLQAGQPVSKQIAIIAKINTLLADTPGAGLN